MPRKGLVISVEGVDKAGKHTQVMKILEYVRSLGIPCETIDFPQYKSYFGKMIKDYLNGEFGTVQALPAEYAMLPYALDRQYNQPLIKKWVNEGRFVIFDRYTYSNLFSVAKCPEKEWESKINFLEETEFNKMGIIKPDYNLYLYIDPKTSYDLRHTAMKDYQNGKPDIHESDFKLLENVAACYRYAALRRPNEWQVIHQIKQDNTRMSVDEVFENIKPKLDQLITNHKQKGR